MDHLIMSYRVRSKQYCRSGVSCFAGAG